jgi:hypothetical protein
VRWCWKGVEANGNILLLAYWYPARGIADSLSTVFPPESLSPPAVFRQARVDTVHCALTNVSTLQGGRIVGKYIPLVISGGGGSCIKHGISPFNTALSSSTFPTKPWTGGELESLFSPTKKGSDRFCSDGSSETTVFPEADGGCW